MTHRAPFIWFGGKRRVAAEVWSALGDVDNYVEPFAGSLAVLLGRPAVRRRVAETVNDADHFLANFWRALAVDPEGVAVAADWPVNEGDLFARHLWLVNEGRSRIAALEADPEFFDVKVAGWWVWGVNAWIGGGWCAGTGPWNYETLENRQLPHRKLPHLGDAGRGVNRQLPHLSDAGQGPGRVSTANVPTSVTPGRVAQMLDLADRLRDVRVCCGDWSRVVTNGALSYGSTVGVFLDPPYLGDVRAGTLYAVDDHTISHAVREWALENGDNPRLRIVLAGYTPEHDHLIPSTWRRHRWSSVRGMAGTDNGNRHLEVLWFSPHCLNATPSLFDALEPPVVDVAPAGENEQ